MKFDFRQESLRSKFKFILFGYNLMIGCSIKKTENYPGKCFWTKEKEPRLKFNPGLALIGLWTTGPRLKFSLKLTDNPALWLVPAPKLCVFNTSFIFLQWANHEKGDKYCKGKPHKRGNLHLGKFTKTKRFRLHVTALDFMAPYAKVSLFFFFLFHDCFWCYYYDL